MVNPVGTAASHPPHATSNGVSIGSAVSGTLVPESWRGTGWSRPNRSRHPASRIRPRHARRTTHPRYQPVHVLGEPDRCVPGGMHRVFRATAQANELVEMTDQLVPLAVPGIRINVGELRK